MLQLKATLARPARLVARGVTSRWQHTPSWASYDPETLGHTKHVHHVQNLCDGKWQSTRSSMEIIHPMDDKALPIFTIPDTTVDEVQPFVESLQKVTKSGLHNPLKHPERYLMYGEISRKVRHKSNDERFCASCSLHLICFVRLETPSCNQMLLTFLQSPFKHVSRRAIPKL